MTRVTLIALPTPFLKDAMNPPLGLCYIGATLEKHGHTVRGVDFAISDLRVSNGEYLSELIDDSDIYGIYCTTAQFKWLKEVCGYLKRIKPWVRIIVGGPHASARPEDCLKVAEADIAVNGEGEDAIIRILNGECLASIPGVCYLEDGKFKYKERASVKKLDSIPAPKLDLFDLSKYKRKLCDEKAIHITTLRGCPYDCNFCNASIVGRNVRYFSVKKVMKHVDHIIEKYGIKNLYIYDDIFTLKKDRLRKFCNEFAKRGINWRCWTRVDLLRKKDLELMVASGLESIAMGIESGHERILKNINKKATVEDNKRAIMLCKEVGVPVRCSLMFGNPGEDEETLQRTIDLMEETQPDEWNLSVLVPTPGSEFWENPDKYGIYFDKAEIEKGSYEALTRSGDTGMGNLLISLDTIPDNQLKDKLKWFVGELERVCPRTKIRDVKQELNIDAL